MKTTLLCASVMATLLTLCSISAPAATWEVLSGPSNPDVMSVDRSSIRSKDGVTRAWAMITYPRTKHPNSPGGKDYRSEQTSFVVRCDTLEFDVIEHYRFSEREGAGKVVSSSDTRPIHFTSARPDSRAMAVVEFVCSHRKP